MLIGNPDKIAFLIERVADWETEDFMNGLFYVFVNGKIYPSSLRTATLNSELYSLLDSNDAGYCIFLISSANHVRFLVGKWNKRLNHHVFTEEVEISKHEMDCLRIQLQNFYQNNCGS